MLAATLVIGGCGTEMPQTGVKRAVYGLPSVSEAIAIGRIVVAPPNGLRSQTLWDESEIL
jgi:hypothetical protein